MARFLAAAPKQLLFMTKPYSALGGASTRGCPALKARLVTDKGAVGKW